MSDSQRICHDCKQPGRTKDGKCVERWGPGPDGPGTVCDRCRKSTRRKIAKAEAEASPVCQFTNEAAESLAQMSVGPPVYHPPPLQYTHQPLPLVNPSPYEPQFQNVTHGDQGMPSAGSGTGLLDTTQAPYNANPYYSPETYQHIIAVPHGASYNTLAQHPWPNDAPLVQLADNGAQQEPGIGLDLYANDAVTPPLWASPTISPDSSFELVSGWDVAASLNQTQPLAPASPTSSMSQGSCATPSFARAPPKSKVTSEATYKASEERRKAERRFACKSEGCSMAFTRKESLSDHINAHQGIKPYQCKWETCGDYFTRKHDCTRHEKTCKRATSSSPPTSDD